MKKEYNEEKEKLASKLYDILDLKNNFFLLCELDQDVEKQEKIMNLIPEIRAIFKSKDLCFLNFKDNKRLKKPYMSIIRGLLKYMKYNLFIETVNIKSKEKENEKGFIRTQKYNILKPNEEIFIL
jgi:hypothetical protein